MTVPFGIAGSDGLMNGVGEVFAASERLVREMMPLQIAPNPLDGVELRGIFRQPFDREPGRAGGPRGSRRPRGADEARADNGPGRGFQQLTAQAGTINGVGILTSLQRVPRAPPAKAPFLRSTTDNREGEMRTPERCSIASANRGNVQFGRSATGVSRSSSATASAQLALTGGGPGATRRPRPA